MYPTSIALILVIRAVAAVQFPNACLQWHSNGTFLIAECTAGTFGSRLTALDLNNCLINAGGHLRPIAWGRFAASCRMTEIENGDINLRAECSSWPGRPAVQNDYLLSDTINVDEGVLNCNGINGCDVGKGSSCLGCDWTDLHADQSDC